MAPSSMPTPSARIFVLLFCLAAVAYAQEPNDASMDPPAALEPTDTDTAPEPTGQITRMPTLEHFVDAPYPAEAEEGLEGAVVLLIEIDETGAVAQAQVVETSGHTFFDDAALEAVRQFSFQPAEIDHVPSPVALQYRYEFVYRAPPPEATEPDKTAGRLVVFEGTARERGTRVPLPHAGATAERDGVTVDAMTDESGHFKFKDLTPGSWRITVRASHFEPYVTDEDIVEGEITVATYYVRRKSSEFEVTVRAPREKKEVARRTLTLEEIRKIPGTQGDAIRVVQNLPGVARTPLNLGPLVVRGGRPGDTRTYIDGQFVPLLFHFGGLTAVINSDFLDTLDFYPGNFPTRYGRSIAGAVDVNTKKTKPDRLHGYANINLTESTLFLEGPIGEKGGFAASVRRSYLDAVLPVIFDLFDFPIGFTIAPRYWDYQLKTDWDFGKDELSFFLFGSNDRLSLILSDATQTNVEGRGNIDTNIAFHRFTARWKRMLTPTVEHRLSATVGTDYSSNKIGADLFVNFTINSLNLREDLTWKPLPSLTIAGGLDVVFATYEYELQGPLPPAPGEMFNPLINDKLASASDAGVAAEPGIWLDAVWRPFGGLKLVPGLRFDYHSMLGRGWFDPRIAAFYEFNEKVLVKASVGLYHQPPTPEKIAKTFGNPELGEEGATQYAAGVEWRFAEMFSLDLQVYYKSIFDEAVRAQQLTTQEAAAAFGNRELLNTGLGRTYGVELLVRKEPGDGIFGWIAVSVANTERRASPEEPWTQSFLNQRYNFIGVVSKKFPYDIDAGIRVRWTEGSPYTPLEGGIFDVDSDQYIPLPSATRRNVRNTDFFQVDLRVDRRWVFERWILDAYVDILNVTWHDNPEGLNYNYDFTQSVPSFSIPIFPAFGVRGEF